MQRKRLLRRVVLSKSNIYIFDNCHPPQEVKICSWDLTQIVTFCVAGEEFSSGVCKLCNLKFEVVFLDECFWVGRFCAVPQGIYGFLARPGVMMSEKTFYREFFSASSKDIPTVNHGPLQPCIFITYAISALPFSHVGQWKWITHPQFY